MTEHRCLVNVPASSANLGPGYDVLAAALELQLELEVEETGDFEVEAGGLDVPVDRTNLCVRAFERLHSADGLRFKITSEIPLAAGLGSSAAAIVAPADAKNTVASVISEAMRWPNRLMKSEETSGSRPST